MKQQRQQHNKSGQGGRIQYVPYTTLQLCT